MIRNYFKIAFRNLKRNSFYTFITIGGLAIGMCVSFILLLFVHNEYNFDKFHENGDHLYKVLVNQNFNNELETSSNTPVQIASTLLKDYPEVERAAVTDWPYNRLFNYQEQSLNLPTQAVSPSFLEMFSFKFLKGNNKAAFKDPYSIVLTESGAKALFGTEDPIGKTVKLNNKDLVKVSAIIEDVPVNSDFQVKAFMSWDLKEIQQPWIKNSGWGNYSFQTYVQLKQNVDPARLNEKLKGVIAKYDDFNKQNVLFLYPFKQVHLYSTFKNGVPVGGNIEHVRLFAFLALGILLIACINFMNLSTARSAQRAKEVGIRKVSGARRGSLIGQFLSESLLLSIIALLIAMVLVRFLLPWFNQLSGQNLFIPYSDYMMWGGLIGVTLITGIIAGSYPALFLSGFKPIKVLKGITNPGKNSLKPRQVLVITQFAFATTMIIASIVIYKQISYIKDRPVGFTRNGVIDISPLDKFEVFRQDAIASKAIVDGAATSSSIVQDGSSSWGIKWPDQKPGEEKTQIAQIAASYHYTSTFGIKLLEGRDFSEAYKSDSSAIILNQAAVKLMRLKNPVGTNIFWQGRDRTIVGVVEDYTFSSPYEPSKPLIIGFMPDWVDNVSLRLNPAQPISKSLETLETLYKKYKPDYPFEYSFLDDNYNKKFKSEQLLGLIANWFTAFAIIISCLGLFGLASFSSEQRRKEIGIRKVLGAEILQLWYALSKEFIQLVIISFIIGAAAGYYFMHDWLQKYTYRTDIGAWVFIATISMSLIICLIAVSYQTIRASLMNPVKSLRTE